VPRSVAAIALAIALVIGGAAAASELPSPDRSPAEVRALADEILSRSEFHQPPETLPHKVQRLFSEAVGRLLENLAGSGAGAVIAWAILAAAVGLVVVLVVRASRSVQLDPRSSPPAVMVELTRTPAEWRAEADRQEASGDWRDALRSRYRALVGELVIRDAIPEIAGRTSGEYVRDIAVTLPAAAVAFAAATELFELAWYGDEPTGPEESTRFRSLSEQVLAKQLVKT
jgi:hypothetical protein